MGWGRRSRFFSNRRPESPLFRRIPPENGKRGRPESLPLYFRLFLLSLDSQNLAAVVGTASFAGSVGHDGLTALGANRDAGSGQLPVGATALIAAGLGHFTLRRSEEHTSELQSR